MEFYVGELYSSGHCFDTKEEVFEYLASLIEVAEKNGKDSFDIEIVSKLK